MITDERTRDCMSREANGCIDLTSAIPYSWRLSKLTPLFKGKCIILEWSNFWRIKQMSHTGCSEITASIFFSRHTIPCSLIFCHTSIGIRSDHMSYSTSSYSQLLSDLLYGYRRYFSSVFARTVVALSVSFIQHVWLLPTPSFLDITILGQHIAFVVI